MRRDWFSKWKLSLFKFFIMMIGEYYEDHLGMFKFTFKGIADLLKKAGFDEIKGKEKGIHHYSLQLISINFAKKEDF